jgi:hypothetical protein
MKTAMQELIDYMKTYFHLTDESLEMFDKALEKEKDGVDKPAQQDLDQWLEDLDKELDILEEEQKERWGIDGKPEE